MPFFRKKPVVIEAIQWEGDVLTADIIEVWSSGSTSLRMKTDGVLSIFIQTLEGEMEASKGDYIIKGIKGEYYPCKPDIFDSSYEEVDKPEN